MKRVEAILTPYKLDAVTQLLIERGCQDIVVSEVKGAESRNGRMPGYRGVDYVTDLPPRVKLEAVVGDADGASYSSRFAEQGEHGRDHIGWSTGTGCFYRHIEAGLLSTPALRK